VGQVFQGWVDVQKIAVQEHWDNFEYPENPLFAVGC
jgi:hypothetical protein